MKNYKIAVLPGDGVGPEVINEGLKVIRAALGKGIGNPVAAILSAAMMFEWLGEKCGDEEASAAGKKIRRAVESILAEGKYRTRTSGARAGPGS